MHDLSRGSGGMCVLSNLPLHSHISINTQIHRYPGINPNAPRPARPESLGQIGHKPKGGGKKRQTRRNVRVRFQYNTLTKLMQFTLMSISFIFLLHQCLCNVSVHPASPIIAYTLYYSLLSFLSLPFFSPDHLLLSPSVSKEQINQF